MQTQITFLERYDRMVEEMEQKVGIEIKATTMSSYHTVRKHLQTFIREKYRTVDIPFGTRRSPHFCDLDYLGTWRSHRNGEPNVGT